MDQERFEINIIEGCSENLGFELSEKDVRRFVVSSPFGFRLIQFTLMLGIIAGEDGAIVANDGSEIGGVTQAGQLEYLMGFISFEAPDL